MTDYAMPPHDLEAEQWALAAMISSPVAIEEACEIIAPGDFFRPAHQIIAQTLITMWACQDAITPVTLKDCLERHGELRQAGGATYIAELYGLPAVAGHGAAHARIVADHARRRTSIEIGTRITQRATTPGADTGEVIADCLAMLEKLTREVTSPPDDLIGVEAFCRRDYARAAPVIPGLLDHEDRVVIVGGEGDGKTTLAYQVAVAASAGVHPFAWEQIPPQRVLIIDLENPRGILQRKLTGLLAIAARHPQWEPGNLSVWSRPGGVDLHRPDDALGVASVIHRARPDLVVAGPVYKMFTASGEGSEAQNAPVTAFWDRMRARFGFALWLEAHAPLMVVNGRRALRPVGSGVWSRWPEFGIALSKRSNQPGVRILDRFKGDREEGRLWPEKITRNPPGGWPWEAVYPEGTFLDPLPEEAR